MDLSIVILNYNSGKYLSQCVKSIYQSLLKSKTEVIVVDNSSTDDSIKLSKNISNKNQLISTKYLELNTNLGFASGNNQGVKSLHPDSKYVIFLNPDTIVEPDTVQCMVDFFDSNPQVDAATCLVNLALTNKIQPECHRGFPYPWRSFCHFSGLSKIFPTSKIFSGYFLGHLDKSKIHQIEACVGAFLMVKKEVGQDIGWWNEKYFFYGEDLDFCYKLFKKGYKLYFTPKCKITHFQGVSSGLISKSKHLSQASRNTKITTALASTQAMRIFYEDNLIKHYPLLFKALIMSGIKLLEMQRLFKAKYL